jgi:hypothetical protein
VGTAHRRDVVGGAHPTKVPEYSGEERRWKIEDRGWRMEKRESRVED